MRAILVCVDYSDILAITLPYNRHHFEEVWVVTSSGDSNTILVAREHQAEVVVTDLFYEPGAVFNKWKALEHGLDIMGRTGWLCIMDADVLWPKELPRFSKEVGNLYTPRRRMMQELTAQIPRECYWKQYPHHRNEAEFAGYSQMFHASDPVLGKPPWHEINWAHAGGADSFFQRKWHPSHKIRPPFDVLHLGPSGHNWCGRATPYVDGTLPPASKERETKLREYMQQRQQTRRFDSEKY